ncbi:MAG: hypothetical protein ACRC0F_06080, partial [Cetobacterium sp.]
MKIDRINQSCSVTCGTKYKTRISKLGYTVTPEENGTFTVKSNVGKILGKGSNVGIDIKDFKVTNNTLLEGLGLELIRNNLLEFMEDIETDYKLIDYKNIIITFHNALTEFGCKRITNTFKSEKGVLRNKQDLIGVKGFKNNNYQIKLYSKHEEQGLTKYEKDLIRIEIILDSRAIDKLKIKKEVTEEKVIEFLLEFLELWKKKVGRANQHSKNTLDLIEKIN